MSIDSVFNSASLGTGPARGDTQSQFGGLGNNQEVPSGGYTILRSHSSAEQPHHRQESQLEIGDSGRDTTWAMRYRHGSRGLATATGQLLQLQEKREEVDTAEGASSSSRFTGGMQLIPVEQPVDTLDNGNTLDTMDVSIGSQTMQMSLAMKTELLDHMRTLDTQSGRRGHNHPLIGNPFLGIPGSRISRTTRPIEANMVQHMAIGSPTADNWTVGEHRERRLLTTMVRKEVRRRTNNQLLLDARRQTNAEHHHAEGNSLLDIEDCISFCEKKKEQECTMPIEELHAEEKCR